MTFVRWQRAATGLDFGAGGTTNLIQRVQDILLKPQPTWPVIEQEQADVASIYKTYLIFLAAIPAVAGFIGMSLIGVGGFALIPSLSVLAILAGLYSIYLIYLGIPVLMKCPQDKAAGYTAVVIVCGILAFIVVGAISAVLTPSGSFSRFGGMRGSGDVKISTPRGEVDIDTSKLEAMAQKMEEAGKRMEAAQKSGDPAAAGKALSEAMGALSGTSGEPIAPQDLKALLPDSLGDLKRDSVEAQGNQAMGIAGSSAKATYAGGDKKVRLSITDIGGLGGLASLAGWANQTLDRETADKVERVYKQGNRTVREESRKDGSRGEYAVILSNGVVVEANGQRVEMAALKAIVEGVDLGKLEALKRPAKS